MGIVGVVACTNQAVKKKEHMPFCREFKTLCIEYRVAVDRIV